MAVIATIDVSRLIGPPVFDPPQLLSVSGVFELTPLPSDVYVYDEPGLPRVVWNATWADSDTRFTVSDYF